MVQHLKGIGIDPFSVIGYADINMLFGRDNFYGDHPVVRGFRKGMYDAVLHNRLQGELWNHRIHDAVPGLRQIHVQTESVAEAVLLNLHIIVNYIYFIVQSSKVTFHADAVTEEVRQGVGNIRDLPHVAKYGLGADAFQGIIQKMRVYLILQGQEFGLLL